MKTSSKTYLIIGSTFIIGLVVGVLLAPMILQGRHQENRRWNSSEGFIKRYEEIIKPTEEQREEIHSILAKYSRKFINARRQLMGKVRIDMDSLKQQLKPILTDQQMENFVKRFRRLQPRSKRKNN